MSYVYLMQATQEQVDKIMVFLDNTLKKDGIAVLQDVVDVYNVVMNASRLNVQPVSEEHQKSLEEQVETQVEDVTKENG